MQQYISEMKIATSHLAENEADENKPDVAARANPLTLADWRRQVAEMYAAVRRNPDPVVAWWDYRARRDRLFLTHPQSPLTPQQRTRFTTIPYYPYNPAWRVIGRLNLDVPHETCQNHLPADGIFRYTRIARVLFTLQGISSTLSLFWIEGYGGGLFLPFKDISNGHTTYGGGRYLYDTIKGADLSTRPEELILDFNYAYNPSCAYNDQWVCPLSPAENTLRLSIEAGEQDFSLV